MFLSRGAILRGGDVLVVETARVASPGARAAAARRDGGGDVARSWSRPAARRLPPRQSARAARSAQRSPRARNRSRPAPPCSSASGSTSRRPPARSSPKPVPTIAGTSHAHSRGGAHGHDRGHEDDSSSTSTSTATVTSKATAHGCDHGQAHEHRDHGQPSAQALNDDLRPSRSSIAARGSAALAHRRFGGAPTSMRRSPRPRCCSSSASRRRACR